MCLLDLLFSFLIIRMDAGELQRNVQLSSLGCSFCLIVCSLKRFEVVWVFFFFFSNTVALKEKMAVIYKLIFSLRRVSTNLVSLKCSAQAEVTFSI